MVVVAGARIQEEGADFFLVWLSSVVSTDVAATDGSG